MRHHWKTACGGAPGWRRTFEMPHFTCLCKQINTAHSVLGLSETGHDAHTLRHLKKHWPPLNISRNQSDAHFLCVQNSCLKWLVRTHASGASKTLGENNVIKITRLVPPEMTTVHWCSRCSLGLGAEKENRNKVIQEWPLSCVFICDRQHVFFVLFISKEFGLPVISRAVNSDI
jgi:hypothetical protein